MVFVYKFFDPLRILMLHGVQPPPRAAWDEYLAEIAKRDVTQLGLLVVTAGGAPDAAQRRGLNRVLDGRRFARAVVHNSTLVRGIVKAVGWFAPGVEAFSPSQWRNAALHAQFEPWEVDALVPTLIRLHEQLDPPVPWFDDMLRGRERVASHP
jgi:hypothetical protein